MIERIAREVVRVVGDERCLFVSPRASLVDSILYDLANGATECEKLLDSLVLSVKQTATR